MCGLVSDTACRPFSSSKLLTSCCVWEGHIMAHIAPGYAAVRANGMSASCKCGWGSERLFVAMPVHVAACIRTATAFDSAGL